MFPDPVDIDLQRIAEPIEALLEQHVVVEEDEVEARDRLRHQLVVYAPQDDGGETLVERGRESDFLCADVGSHRIGTEYEYNSVGLSDQGLDARPPVLKGVDLAAVDQRLELTLLEGGFQPIREGHVLARIGDKDLDLG